MKVRLLALCTILLAACGGEEPVAKPPPPAPTVAPADTGPKLVATQELGSIDEDKTNATFNSLNGSAFQKCLNEGAKRLDFLGGEAKFFVRIGADGHAKYSYFEDSTLGDHDTEQCMLDAIDQAQWPVPVGGEAEARYTTNFEPPGDARPPADWDSDRIAEALGKHKEDIGKCTSGVDAKFTVTAYVKPAGKKAGKVMAVGVATSNKKGIPQIQCVADAIKGMKVPSPGSYWAKVTFSL